jgi:hypothetical protein
VIESEHPSAIMDIPQVREWLEMVQDKNSACVDRGRAIVELIRSDMLQREIADKTKLAPVTISHLKKCFLHLKGKARQMCKDRKMNADACYLLARRVDTDQEHILRQAIKLREINDTRLPKGRRTPPRQITEQNIIEAIMEIERATK